jgi:dTDP-4-amino-4,6-dideoxygalactose transaminase
MNKERIWLSSPHMGGNEQLMVDEVFRTNWVAPVGPYINLFERELSQYTGTANVAALSSGTAAIHLALVLMGVSQGDEVICSSFTFSGSCNPIVYVGATPVFVDSEETTWNMDPDLLEEAIRDRKNRTGNFPKAIIVVHLYGMPAQIDRIKEVADRYEIPVIEDAAEALGSTWNGQKLGTFGDLGILSFNGNKIITTGGGGAILSNNSERIAKARYLATQARQPVPHYEHTEIGYNYRLSNVSAAIGCGQLQVLDKHIAIRRSNFSYYREAFRSFEVFEFLDELPNAFCNRWLTTVLIKRVKSGSALTWDSFRLALESQNIETRPLWKPMHLQPVFKGMPFYGRGVSQKLFDRGLCLPSGSNLTQSQLERVVQEIKAFLNQNGYL